MGNIVFARFDGEYILYIIEFERQLVTAPNGRYKVNRQYYLHTYKELSTITPKQ